MKTVWCLLIAFLPLSAFAGKGDTLTVRTHDRVHMNWYGNFDTRTFFPTQGKSYQRVKMHYTLGCPDQGCSEWDYTAQVFLRQPSGMMDSTLKSSPNFRVNGAVFDSFYYRTDTVFTYFFNTQTQEIDSTSKPSVLLYLFTDSLEPTRVTDSLTVWDAWGFRPVYDANGTAVDSVPMEYDSVLYRSDYQWYEQFEIIHNLELGRIITPYAADKTKDWSFTYTFDITEFAPFLVDSVDIRAHYSGYQDGFTVSLDFEFMEGEPALTCREIIPLWQGGFPYGAATGIETYLVERNVQIQKTANTRVMLRVIQTGHGFGGTENCAEFCAKDHYVKVNGTQRFTTTVWKEDCGSNAIYPQPGTWIYDRANWCPGEAVRNYDYWIDEWITDGNNTIDLDMQPFTNTGGSSSYIISGYLVVYEENPQVPADVALDEIIAPNDRNNFVRFNPTCGMPRVRIRNTSMKPVQSVSFKYGVDGGTQHLWTWHGVLDPQQSKEIDLGFFDWTGASSQRFQVSIEAVNGAQDGESQNNTLQSEFTLTPQFPEEFQIWFKANKKGEETTLSVHGLDGTVIWSRTGFAPGESVRDTVRLVDGCYYFKVSDSARNGFKFWANDDGTGSLTLRQMTGTLIRVVDGDFGTDRILYFTVGHPLHTPGMDRAVGFELYPNPAGRELHLELNLTGECSLRLLDVQGKLLKTERLTSEGTALLNWDLSGLPPGVYWVELSTGQSRLTRKLVVQ